VLHENWRAGEPQISLGKQVKSMEKAPVLPILLSTSFETEPFHSKIEAPILPKLPPKSSQAPSQGIILTGQTTIEFHASVQSSFSVSLIVVQYISPLFHHLCFRTIIIFLSVFLPIGRICACTQFAIITQNLIVEKGAFAESLQVLGSSLLFPAERGRVTVIEEEVDGIVFGAREAVARHLAHRLRVTVTGVEVGDPKFPLKNTLRR
jgi:hypothetical protein